MDDKAIYRLGWAALSAIRHHGEWRLNHCIHQTEGWCTKWTYAGSSDVYWLNSGRNTQGRYQIKPDAPFCATCPSYSGRA